MKLTRFCYGPHGTFGVLEVGGKQFYTCEPPWRDNAIGESCIPEGTYPYHRDHTGRFHGFRLTDTEPRTAIEFHAGNTMKHTDGCILPGLKLAFVNGLWAVGNSSAAMKELIRVAPEEGTLTITSVFAAKKQSKKKKAASESEDVG